MPVPKGYRRPVEILRLTLGSVVTEEDVAAVQLALRLKQTVTARLSTEVSANDASISENCIVLEARPT